MFACSSPITHNRGNNNAVGHSISALVKHYNGTLREQNEISEIQGRVMFQLKSFYTTKLLLRIKV